METKKLKKMVQNNINKKISKSYKHFSTEKMNLQIEALIEVLAPLIVKNFEEGNNAENNK